MKKALLEKNRIEAISDGIYAIAMTLAVLSIDVSTIDPTHSSLISGLPRMAEELRHYIIAFVTLAGFWVGQHFLMDRIKRTDTGLNWIVMFHLMFIALIPATTDLLGNFDSVLVVQLFCLNIFFVSLTISLEYLYARKHSELGPSHELKKHISHGTFIFPTFSVLVFVMAWPLGDWAPLLYVLMPLIHKLPRVDN